MSERALIQQMLAAAEAAVMWDAKRSDEDSPLWVLDCIQASGAAREYLAAPEQDITEADKIRNACPRTYNHCGYDAIAGKCLAEGCLGHQHIAQPTELTDIKAWLKHPETKSLQAELQAAKADAQRMREALEKLARLGNGDYYGNSEGNVIAREALDRGRL